jgi:hypothetical protein
MTPSQIKQLLASFNTKGRFGISEWWQLIWFWGKTTASAGKEIIAISPERVAEISLTFQEPHHCMLRNYWWQVISPWTIPAMT